MPEFDSLATALGDRLAAVPRFKKVLRTRPLDLAAPEWVEAGALDLSHHVRRAAVLQPGDDAELF